LISLVLLGGTVAIYALYSRSQQPVRLGFVAQLTGVQAELGVQERNGVQLALEEINARGGINGRRIDLVVQDDLGTPEGAQHAVRELLHANVVAIIGHATSGQTIAGLTVATPARVVMLSPTATTPELSGKEDYFFRVCYSLVDRAHTLARHIYLTRDIPRIAALHDTDNTAYSNAYLAAFVTEYQALGGSLTAQAAFSSRTQPDFAPLAAQLRASQPNALLIIAADMETAMIAQRTRLMGWPVPLFTTAWAQTETLIHNGGQAVEGLELELAMPLDDLAPDYLRFTTRYQERFGQASSFGAAMGYEAATVMAVALEKTRGQADGLALALAGIKDVRGLTDTLSMNKYGDIIRPFHLGAIRDGKFVHINALPSTNP